MLSQNEHMLPEAFLHASVNLLISVDISNHSLLLYPALYFRSMQKSQDGGLMDGNSTHHWSEDDHLPKKPRVRDGISTALKMTVTDLCIYDPSKCISPTSQMEDKPLLPVGGDGGVDRREWTLQHHKAADITLTPPQADIDMDSLDVNVKGPG